MQTNGSSREVARLGCALALALSAGCARAGQDGQRVQVVPCVDVVARGAPPPRRSSLEASAHGVLLEDLTWLEAEKRLDPNTVVVLPIGAAAKEHGPHLLLKNDFLLAEYFKRRVVEASSVVVAPTLNYHFYPAFAEYPGSTSLRVETARDLVIDIVRSLAAFGPRRFYALNTGLSTLRALRPAAEALRKVGVLLQFTDLSAMLKPIEEKVAKQEGGSHADEIETSMMLYIAPETVDMKKAVKDYDPNRNGGFSRRPGTGSTYSPSGAWGDPTLATREKGEIVVEALVKGLLADIETLRNAELPNAEPAGG